MGYVDGPSQYGFAGNSPANSGDPLGLYEADFHLGLTEYLAGWRAWRPGPLAQSHLPLRDRTMTSETQFTLASF